MKNRLIGMFLALMALLWLSTSCTHKPYHPDKTDREWTIDHDYCERWVREGIRDEPDTYDSFDEMRLIRQCMKNKGWQWERTEWFKPKQEPVQ